MNIIKYAKMATQAWGTFIKENSSRKSIKRYFHLRPTNSGITIVTTLSGYEMRGITKINDENTLLSRLKDIENQYAELTSIDKDTRNCAMNKLGFSCRGKAADVKLEEKIQANMIDTMSDDENLKNKLGSNNLIRFTASELIFEKGKHRVDIVGCDGRDVYLFELKKGRTAEVGQVREYVDYYSKKVNKTFRHLLEIYPMNPAKKFESIIGVMVMEYAESSSGLKKWKNIAKENKIRILFYKPSLIYETIA